MKMEIRSVQFKPSEYFFINFSMKRNFYILKNLAEWNLKLSIKPTIEKTPAGSFQKKTFFIWWQTSKNDFENKHYFQNIQDLKKKVYFAYWSWLSYQIKTFNNTQIDLDISFCNKVSSKTKSNTQPWFQNHFSYFFFHYFGIFFKTGSQPLVIIQSFSYYYHMLKASC